MVLKKSTKEVIRSVNRGTENTMELKKKDSNQDTMVLKKKYQTGNQKP